MQKAIILGGSGLLGQSLAKYLSSKKIEVLCIGQRSLTIKKTKKLFGNLAKYIQLDIRNIDRLQEILNEMEWSPGSNCIFYNFAWRGNQSLTDGTIDDQMLNVSLSTSAIIAAKKLGCKKFINSGTLEETYIEWHLNNDKPYDSPHLNYAISKLASRDMCLMVSYIEKIDYVHTRLSVPLFNDLSIGGYVSQTLKKISKNKEYDLPHSNQLYDILPTSEVARAYYSIGLKGKNKSDYFIGSGLPTSLGSYFYNFEQYLTKQPQKDYKNTSVYPSSFFDISDLTADTGFIPSENLFSLLEIGAWNE